MLVLAMTASLMMHGAGTFSGIAPLPSLIPSGTVQRRMPNNAAQALGLKGSLVSSTYRLVRFELPARVMANPSGYNPLL